MRSECLHVIILYYMLNILDYLFFFFFSCGLFVLGLKFLGFLRVGFW